MNKIKEQRLKKGISQKELAEMCNIRASTMCDIEKGRCKPSIKTAAKLAKALDVKDINFFI